MRGGFRQLWLPGNCPDGGRIAVSALRAEIDVTVCIVSGNPVRAPNRQYLEALAFVEIPAIRRSRDAAQPATILLSIVAWLLIRQANPGKRNHAH
ncbi:hypothetical protein [Burkholderia paludis]|uniref:hypothetical protein n=1 Tax=Burkholderia paludis TaxID=1506587 RepID=UPI00126A14CC|nr:hypothetical protein [Burkholderia paludis]